MKSGILTLKRPSKTSQNLAEFFSSLDFFFQLVIYLCDTAIDCCDHNKQFHKSSFPPVFPFVADNQIVLLVTEELKGSCSVFFVSWCFSIHYNFG